MTFIKIVVTILSLGVYAAGELCIDSTLEFKTDSGETTSCAKLVVDSKLDCTHSDTVSHCRMSCDVSFCCADSQATFGIMKPDTSTIIYRTCDWKRLEKQCGIVPNLVDTCPVTCGKCNPVSVLLDMIKHQNEIIKGQQDSIDELRNEVTDQGTVIEDQGTVIEDQGTAIEDQGTAIEDQGEQIEVLEAEVYEYSFYGNYTYKLAKMMTWAEHEATAVSWGGHLTSIHNAEENDFIANLIDIDSFIGLKADEEGSWEFTDGSPFDYSNWRPGEPNSKSEKVVAIYHTNGEFNDASENLKQHGIYKKLTFA